LTYTADNFQPTKF